MPIHCLLETELGSLGLPICKGIVEGLRDKIWFESDVGKGTTFYFSISKAIN